MSDKSYCSAYVKSFNEEERTLTAVASSGKIDRDNEVSRISGWDFADYQKHPVILLSHNSRELWVGKTLWIKKTKDQGLLFKMQFATTDAAQEAFTLVKDTGICAFSVGFEVLSFEDMLVKDLEDYEKEGTKLRSNDKVRVLTKMKLFEISITSLPADQNALMKSAYEPTEIVRLGMSGDLIKYKSLSKEYEDIDFSNYMDINREKSDDLDSVTTITITPEELNAMIDERVAQAIPKVEEEPAIEIDMSEPMIEIELNSIDNVISKVLDNRYNKIIDDTIASVNKKVKRALGIVIE